VVEKKWNVSWIKAGEVAPAATGLLLIIRTDQVSEKFRTKTAP